MSLLLEQHQCSLNGRCAMSQRSNIEAFWQSYLSTRSEEDQKTMPVYAVEQFADIHQAATKVGKLVGVGIKRTNSSFLWGLEAMVVEFHVVGEIELVVNETDVP